MLSCKYVSASCACVFEYDAFSVSLLVHTENGELGKCKCGRRPIDDHVHFQ